MYEWLYCQRRSTVSVRNRSYMRYIRRTRIDALMRVCIMHSRLIRLKMQLAYRFNRRVTTLTTHSGGNRTNKVDDRRNLYVLGLPFALTK